jgi:tetrahydromethanopterin S-methyltransferase subunit C
MTRQRMAKRVLTFGVLAGVTAVLLAQVFPELGELFVGLGFIASFLFAMAVGRAGHARGASQFPELHEPLR